MTPPGQDEQAIVPASAVLRTADERIERVLDRDVEGDGADGLIRLEVVVLVDRRVDVDLYLAEVADRLVDLDGARVSETGLPLK